MTALSVCGHIYPKNKMPDARAGFLAAYYPNRIAQPRPGLDVGREGYEWPSIGSKPRPEIMAML